MGEKLRVLHISKYYEPHKGGIEDVCRTIVNIAKGDSNIEQSVLCFNDSNVNSEDVVDGIKVYRAAVFLNIASQSISFSYYFILKRLIKEIDPHTIHFHCPNPLVSLFLLMLKPNHCKLIIHWHSDIVDQKFLYKLIKHIESRVLKICDKIIATSPTYIDDSAPLRLHRDKVCVLPNVINDERFNMTDEVEEKVLHFKQRYNGKPIVLFVGRHVSYKGLRYLIEAAKQSTKDAVYLIGGTGPLTEELKREAKDLQNVHFLGRIPNGDLIALYHAADIFAFPSITKNEAFGVVLAEAMYCNTPAVTFTIKGSGVNWVNLNGDTGIEVENSNSSQLAEAIDSLLDDENRRKELGANAHNRVKKLFVKDEIVKAVLDYYR